MKIIIKTPNFNFVFEDWELYEKHGQEIIKQLGKPVEIEIVGDSCERN